MWKVVPPVLSEGRDLRDGTRVTSVGRGVVRRHLAGYDLGERVETPGPEDKDKVPSTVAGPLNPTCKQRNDRRLQGS